MRNSARVVVKRAGHEPNAGRYIQRPPKGWKPENVERCEDEADPREADRGRRPPPHEGGQRVGDDQDAGVSAGPSGEGVETELVSVPRISLRLGHDPVSQHTPIDRRPGQLRNARSENRSIERPLDARRPLASEDRVKLRDPDDARQPQSEESGDRQARESPPGRPLLPPDDRGKHRQPPEGREDLAFGIASEQQGRDRGRRREARRSHPRPTARGRSRATERPA